MQQQQYQQQQQQQQQLFKVSDAENTFCLQFFRHVVKPWQEYKGYYVLLLLLNSYKEKLQAIIF